MKLTDAEVIARIRAIATNEVIIAQMRKFEDEMYEQDEYDHYKDNDDEIRDYLKKHEIDLAWTERGYTCAFSFTAFIDDENSCSFTLTDDIEFDTLQHNAGRDELLHHRYIDSKRFVDAVKDHAEYDYNIK